MKLNKTILNIIHQDFEPKEIDAVTEALSSITLNHVMAASEENLERTRQSILKLAKGNVETLIELTKCAKIDFRDVIMWAMENE